MESSSSPRKNYHLHSWTKPPTIKPKSFANTSEQSTLVLDLISDFSPKKQENLSRIIMSNTWNLSEFPLSAEKLPNLFRKKLKLVVTDLLECQCLSLAMMKKDLTSLKSTLQEPTTTGKPPLLAKTQRMLRSSWRRDIKLICRSKTLSIQLYWLSRKDLRARWVATTSRLVLWEKIVNSRSWLQPKSRNISTNSTDCRAVILTIAMYNIIWYLKESGGRFLWFIYKIKPIQHWDRVLPELFEDCWRTIEWILWVYICCSMIISAFAISSSSKDHQYWCNRLD